MPCSMVGDLGVVSSLTWTASGERLISGGSDGRLRWWDVPREECVRIRKAHQGTVQALKVSPDGRRLASCGDDGDITLWDLERGDPLRTLRLDRPYERLNITGIRGLTEAQKMISGPLLDRIDIHVEVPRVDYEKLADKHNVEDSKTNRARVKAAREWQLERFKGTKCIKFTPELFIRERG
jgi:WD40 repeat protein